MLPEPYALLRLKKGVRGNVVRVLIDVTTGREVWDSSTFGMTDVYHERYVPSLDALLVAGKADERKMVVAVDLESGHRLREFAVPEADVDSILNESVLFDTDSTVLTASGDRLIRYDLQSGAMSWTSPGLDVGTRKDCAFLNAPPGKSGFVVAPNAERNDPRPLLPVAPMLPSSDGRCVFAARGQSLQALDASGLALWRNPPELCGRCVQMLETRAGLLARTMPEIAGNDQLVMLERGTGSILWQYPPFSRHTKLIIIMSAFRSVTSVLDPT